MPIISFEEQEKRIGEAIRDMVKKKSEPFSITEILGAFGMTSSTSFALQHEKLIARTTDRKFMWTGPTSPTEGDIARLARKVRLTRADKYKQRGDGPFAEPPRTPAETLARGPLQPAAVVEPTNGAAKSGTMKMDLPGGITLTLSWNG